MNHEIVLITGAGSGFGRLTAETLARNGYTVIASLRDRSGRNAKAAEELQSSGGGRISVVELDVASDESVEAAAAAIRASHGHVDVVVNNAGIASIGLVETFTASQFQSLLNVNTVGAHRVNRAFLPMMKERGKGLLIHVSSTLGRLVVSPVGLYCASKFGLEALAEAYSYELRGLNIESILVEPGAFPTDLGYKGLTPDEPQRAAEYGPLADAPGALMPGLQAMFSAPDGPKSEEVAQAILGLIQMPQGNRPLRTVVDRFGGSA